MNQKALIKLPGTVLEAMNKFDVELANLIREANGQWVDVINGRGEYKKLQYKGVEFELHAKAIKKMVKL